MERKQRGVCLAVLAMAALLLVSCLALWLRLGQTEKQLEVLAETVEQLQADESTLRETAGRLEESRSATRPLVEAYEFSVMEVDSKAQTMTLFLSLTLSQEKPDGIDIIVRIPGDAAELRRTGTRADLQINGRYTGQLTLPVDTALALDFSVEDARDDASWEELFCSVSTIATLLPVQPTNFSGDVHYNREEQRFYWTEWIFDLKETSKVPGGVTNPVLRVYKNGELAAENPCQTEAGGSYWDAADSSNLPCQPGDRIEFRFACADAYGLGYEFPVQWWEVTEFGTISHWPNHPCPILSWNE